MSPQLSALNRMSLLPPPPLPRLSVLRQLMGEVNALQVYVAVGDLASWWAVSVLSLFALCNMKMLVNGATV